MSRQRGATTVIKNLRQLLIYILAVIGTYSLLWIILPSIASAAQQAFGPAEPSVSSACTLVTPTLPTGTRVLTSTGEITSTDVLPEVSSVTGTLALGNEVTFQIDHLSTYLDKNEKSSQTIVPFINGRALKDIYPNCIDEARNQLRFRLTRTTNNKDVVDAILRSSLWDEQFTDLQHEVIVSAGYEDGKPFPVTNSRRTYFVVAQPGWLLFWVVISISVFVILLFSAIKFDLLRTALTNDKLLAFQSEYNVLELKPAYSLGLFQVALWFIII